MYKISSSFILMIGSLVLNQQFINLFLILSVMNVISKMFDASNVYLSLVHKRHRLTRNGKLFQTNSIHTKCA